MKYRIGVDIGGTSIKAGLVSEELKIIDRRSLKTPDTFEKSMKALADMVFDLAASAGSSIEDFPCIGIGTPCSVIPKTGRLVFANNTGWKNVSITDELTKYFSIPVYAGNDANCAVIGESIAGAAKGRKNVVMVTLGTGVGGGIILNGKLFAGGDGLGAELGHTPLFFGGIRCTCGLYGCFENYASATGLIRQTKQAMAEDPSSSMHEWVRKNGDVTGRTAFECAQAGDKTALRVVDQYASYLAGGLGGFINVFRPELVLVGGGISNAGDFLLDKVNHLLSQTTLAYEFIGAPPVKKAALGNDAGIIGAAFLDQQ